jgi:hypothetical protein
LQFDIAVGLVIGNRIVQRHVEHWSFLLADLRRSRFSSRELGIVRSSRLTTRLLLYFT